jgi:tetratricopeptide (TPR) repeat protein
MRKEIIVLIGVLIIVLNLKNGFCLNTDNIKTAVLSGNYRQAVIEGEKIIAGKSNSSGLDEVYYLLGLSLLKEGSYRRAAGYFETVIKDYRQGRFVEEARLGLGDTYLLRGEADYARSAYKELIESSPAAKLKAQALQRLSQVSFTSQDSATAKQYLERLDKEFPQNIEPKTVLRVESAKISLLTQDGEYSVQVGSFSSKSNAEGLVGKLSQGGYTAYTEIVTPSGVVSYRVKVGRLNSRQDAEDLEKKLSKEGYPTKICP